MIDAILTVEHSSHHIEHLKTQNGLMRQRLNQSSDLFLFKISIGELIDLIMKDDIWGKKEDNFIRDELVDFLSFIYYHFCDIWGIF